MTARDKMIRRSLALAHCRRCAGKTIECAPTRLAQSGALARLRDMPLEVRRSAEVRRDDRLRQSDDA
jgi:hypothetical protein